MPDNPPFPIPERLARTAREMLGDTGAAWLRRLPGIAAECARRWSLALGAPFPQLSINYAAPGIRADGAPVVLKICIPGPEFLTEAEALRLCDGRGSVQLLAADLDQGALLLERLHPGTPLLDIDAAPEDGDEARANSIAAGVMRQLCRPVPASHPFPSFNEWVEHMAERSPRLLGDAHPRLSRWIDYALALFADLRASGDDRPVVLHGDLHHGNILSATRQPWLAIDPKGVVGEPVCETGPLLINALPSPVGPAAFRRCLDRRVDQLAEELGFDRQRLRAWGIVRAVMSSYWTVEDHGYEAGDSLWAAEALAGAAR